MTKRQKRRQALKVVRLASRDLGVRSGVFMRKLRSGDGDAQMAFAGAAGAVGVSMDGVSQSVGTAGPQFLANRIKDLEGIIDKQKEAIKGYYQKRWNIDSF